MDLRIRKAEAADTTAVQRWLEADTGPSNLVGHYEHTGIGAQPVTTNNTWVATLDDELVAYAALAEEPGREVRLSFIVRPDRRREGIAKTFIPLLLQTANLSSYAKLKASLPFEDIAVRKILERSGFHQIGNDETGRIVFVRR